MTFFTIPEIINLIILTLAIGFIFYGYVKEPTNRKNKFNLKSFNFALLVSAPGIVFHELAHKFVAQTFGLTANFFIYWWGLGIAIFLKLISSPFIIIAPGYVGIDGSPTEIQSILTSFAGPFVNLSLFLISHLILNYSKKLSRKQAITFYLTKKINLILFIFNMIPIPPLDGFKVIFGLFRLLFP